MINIIYFFKCLECGHFCINYVLKKDGKKRREKYNKRLMSLGLVVSVLKKYYDSVNCYKVRDLDAINKNKRFITLIETKKDTFHYIVVERIENDIIYYYDPAFLGLKKVNKSKFEKRWSNYCCFFY